MYFVYVLKSKKDGNLYIGRTNNFDRRFSEHESGKVQSTKSRRPFDVLKIIEVKTEIESVFLEKELKKGYSRENLKKEFENGNVA